MSTTRTSSRRLLAAGLTAAALAVGCTQSPETLPKRQGPAKVTPIEGTKTKSVTLTDRAAERIGVQMAPIVDEGGVRVLPYTALVYDATGGTFAFTSPKPLTFVRTAVAVTRITSGKVYLSDGPPAGTEVVTVGSAELYGAEQGLGY